MWVVSEHAYGAEITSIVGVASSPDAARAMAEESHNSLPSPMGPLHWDEDEAWAMWSGRRFTGIYSIERFVVH